MPKPVVGRYLIVPAWLIGLLKFHAYVTQLQALDSIMTKKQHAYIVQICNEVTQWAWHS